MATSLQQYRDRYPGLYGNLSDVATINKMAEVTGDDPQSLAIHFGIINPNQGDFTRGLTSGVDSMQGGLYGLAGYVGDVVGSDKLRDFGYKGYEDNMAEVSLRSKPTDNVENNQTAGDWVDSAQYWLGYAIPQIVEAVVGSKGAGFATRKAVESQVKKELTKKFGKNTGAINAVMKSKATQAQLKKATNRGSIAGIGTQAVGTELGFTYGGAVDKAIEDGKTIEDVDLMRVTKYGLAAGAAEALTDVATLGLARIGPAKDLMSKAGKSSSRVRNAATRGLAGSAMEAGTEMIQTGLEEMGAGHEYDVDLFLDPTSAFAGAVGGGAMGTVGGAATKGAPSLDQIKKAAEKAQANAAAQAETNSEQQEEEKEEQGQAQQQQANAADELEALRETHELTFPDRNTWSEDALLEQEVRNRLEVQDPATEIGTAFKEWRAVNKERLSKNTEANNALINAFLKDYAVTPNVDEQKAAHLQALDEHAQLQESKANEDPAKIAEINVTLSELLDNRNRALENGDIKGLNAVEQEVAEATAIDPLFQARWNEFKRNAVEQEAFDKAASIEEAKALKEQAKLDKTAAAEQKKVDAATQKEEAAQQKRFAAAEKRRVAEESKAKAEEAKKRSLNIAKINKESETFTFDSINDLEINFSKQERQIYDYIKKRIEDGDADGLYTVPQSEGKAGKGSSKAKGWATTEIATALGIAGKGNVPNALKRINAKIRKVYGTDIDQLAAAINAKEEASSQNRDNPELFVEKSDVAATGAPIDSSESVDETEALNTAAVIVNDGLSPINSEGQTQLGPQVPVTGNVLQPEKDVAKNVELIEKKKGKKAAKKEAAKIVEVDESEEALVAMEKKVKKPLYDATPDPQGEKRRKEAEEKTKFQQSTALEKVKIILANKNATDDIAVEWNSRKSKGIPAFSSLTTEQQHDWAQSVLSAIAEKSLSSLDVFQKNLETEIKKDAKSNRKPKVKSKKVVEGSDSNAADQTTTGTNTNSNATTNVKKIPKEVKPKVSQLELSAVAYATEKLGANWETSKLKRLLKAKKLKAFQTEVDSLAEVDVQIDEATVRRPLPKTERAKKETFENMFRKLLGQKAYDRIKSRVLFFDTVEQAQKEYPGSDFSYTSAFVAKAYKIDNLPGFREKAKLRTKDKMIFVLENIKVGREAATFMHEIGSHIGLDNILSPREMAALVKKIRTWAKEADNRNKLRDSMMGNETNMTERLAAAEAVRRVNALKRDNQLVTSYPVDKNSSVATQETTKEDKEIVAYFITEAIQMYVETDGAYGVLPSETSGELGKILNKFRQAFRKFIGYMKNESDTLTAQNIVDLAFGAARIELAGEGYAVFQQDSDVTDNTVSYIDTLEAIKNDRDTVTDKDFSTFKGQKYSNYSDLESKVRNMPLAYGDAAETRKGDAVTEKLIRRLRQQEQAGVITSGERWNALMLEIESNNKAYAASRGIKQVTPREAMMINNQSNFKLTPYWSDRIDFFISIRFPKNDKGHYITDSYIPLTKDWQKFQDNRAALEAKIRKSLKATAQERIKDAEAHERRMDDPDSNFIEDADYSMNEPEKEKSAKEIAVVREWIRTNMGTTAAKIWTDITEIFSGGANSTKFLHQFINDVKGLMPAAGKWHRAILELEKTRNEIKQTVDDIAIRAREMKEKELNRVNQFIEKSTVEQLWGYNPYEKTDPRYKNVKIDPEMQKIFNGLNKEQQTLAIDVFAHGDAMLKRKRDIAALFGLENSYKEFFGVSGLEGPYAPLRRFGNYVAEFKSTKYLAAEALAKEVPNKINKEALALRRTEPENYEVSFFETFALADAYVYENRNKFEYSEASEKTKINSEGNSPDYQVLSRVLAGLKASDFGKDSAEYKAIKEMIENMYFDTLSEDNARRSQAKRKSIAGYETNMMRSFLANATAEANLIANMEHGTNVNVALLEAKAQKNTPGAKAKLSKVYNMMVSHYSENLNQKPTPIQDKVAALNTVYMLTSSIGYHITNATQPIMVTIPKLVGDFGSRNYGKTMKLYWQGLSMARDVVTFNAKNFKFQTAIDITKAPKKYQKLLKELQLRQLLDVGIEQDLAEFNRSDSGYEMINKATETAGNFAHRLYQIARLVEAYNRISTATAAFEMAEANPEVTKRLNTSSQEYAISIVQDTQGNFSAMDAPLILKKLPKITGQYRKYQIMMAWVYADATKKAFKGTSPQEKAAGKRTVGFALGHAAMFSGMTGVPVIGMIAPVFLGIGNDGDEPEDLERWIRENVEDETLATLISRGLPSVFGVDMSTKLSQQKIFHPLPYTDFGADQESLRNAFFEAVSGPFGATASNFMRSLEYAKDGNLWRATEYALPKGVRTAMESFRLGTEGYSLRNGDIPAGPENFGGWALALNALGIPATDINKIKWTRGQQYELNDWFQKEQSKIRSTYIKAKKDNNRSAARDAIDTWKSLQQSKDRVRPFFNNERGSLKRTPLSSLLKAPSKQQKREQKYSRQLGTN